MLTLAAPTARGGRAKVSTLLASARLSTTAATLTAIAATTSYISPLRSGAGAARQPSTPPPPPPLPLPPAGPQPPALHRAASSRGYSDWALRLRMGDNNPLTAASAAISTTSATADSVTSWDLTVRKTFWCV